MKFEFSADTIEDVEKQLQEAKMALEKQRILNLHTVPVTMQKDGRWHTRIKLPNGKWKSLAKASRDDLNDILYQHYKNQADIKTIRNVFDEWIEWKQMRREIRLPSVTRYTNWFLQFFGEIGGNDVKTLADYRYLEQYVYDQINRHELTGKTVKGLHLVLAGILNYATAEEYIDYPATAFFGRLMLSRKSLAPQREKSDADEVFTEEEAGRLAKYFVSHSTVRNLGLLLMFQAGVRIGELSAIRWDCVDMDALVLTIRATEIQYDKYAPDGTKHRVVEVQNVPKTDKARRDIILPDISRTVLKRIKMMSTSDEWMFVNEHGERFRGKNFYDALHSACRALGIPLRSTHPVRKTYASALIDAGTPAKIVQNQMGHADISTTEKYYHRDRSTMEVKKQHINKAINM